MKEIILTQGKVALVDDEDYDYLNQWKWHAWKHRHTFYAINRKVGRMHRVIMDVCGKDILIDHADGYGLNNQKNNLRQATVRQNNSNTKSRKNSTSNYLGVHYDSSSKKWRAGISFNKKDKKIGRFNTEAEAAIAYNKEATRLHGEFANLNIIKS